MIWFGKSFIKFCKSFTNLIKLVSTRTCSSARVRPPVNFSTVQIKHAQHSREFRFDLTNDLMMCRLAQVYRAEHRRRQNN